MADLAGFLEAMLFPEETIKGRDYLGVHITESSRYFKGWEPTTTNALIDVVSQRGDQLSREEISSRWHPAPQRRQFGEFRYLIDITNMPEAQITQIEQGFRTLEGIYLKRIRIKK